jgi:hypothetical protein
MDTEEIRRLVAAAGFIYRADILHHRAGEAQPAPAEAGEIVATRIKEVLRSTPVLRSLAGQEALVVSKHSGALRQHHDLILFADVISLGRQLLLHEIGHVEIGEEIARQVAKAIREADERPFRERVAGADLIVTGEVVESHPTESARRPKSEHDPIWWIARVAVKAVHKGRKPRGDIEVLFASSTDRVWFNSPKLTPGTSGIFLLQHVSENEVPKEVPRTTYQATDPLDLIPAGRLPDVERLLGGDRGDR